MYTPSIMLRMIEAMSATNDIWLPAQAAQAAQAEQEAQAAQAYRQPKREFADYVESEGHKAPRCYESIRAQAANLIAGRTFIYRSDNPIEHDGPSGLWPSYEIDIDGVLYGQTVRDEFPDMGSIENEIDKAQQEGRGAWTVPDGSRGPGYEQIEDMIIGDILTVDEEVTQLRFKSMQAFNRALLRYEDITSQNPGEIRKETSYTCQEYIPGTNVMVVADDSRSNRYHLVVQDSRVGKVKPAYAGGGIFNGGGEMLRGEFSDGEPFNPGIAQRLVDTYEAIRNLPRLDSRECPMVEMKLNDPGEIWVLQYHKTHRVNPATEDLDLRDFDARDGWLEVDAARGFLPEPTKMNMLLWYPEYYGSKSKGKALVPNAGEAFVDCCCDIGLSEALARTIDAYVADVGFDRMQGALADSHERKSTWFKPKVSVALDDRGLKKLIPEEIINRVLKERSANNLAKVVVEIVSDGRKGLIRYDRESEQPMLTPI